MNPTLPLSRKLSRCQNIPIPVFLLSQVSAPVFPFFAPVSSNLHSVVSKDPLKIRQATQSTTKTPKTSKPPSIYHQPHYSSNVSATHKRNIHPSTALKHGIPHSRPQTTTAKKVRASIHRTIHTQASWTTASHSVRPIHTVKSLRCQNKHALVESCLTITASPQRNSPTAPDH